MEIISTTATLHKIPVDLPRIDERTEWDVIFVEVETDSDITGYGLTSVPQAFGIRAFVNREVDPLLEGENPLETERIWHLLQQELNERVQTGVWSSAVSAVDIALWDIKGKHYEEPVWRLLGGSRNPVPTYVTFGLKRYNREQLVDVATDFVSQGETGLKMKVGINGATDPLEDARRVESVREAVGEDVDLMIDANYEFSFDMALRLCNRIEQYDIAWFEEPLYGNDANLLADLRQRTRIPIAAGQNEGHRFRHRDLITERAVDIPQPNVCHVGGYTEAQKVAALAQSFNLRIANGGGWPHHNMHLHAGLSNGGPVEFHYVAWKLGEKIYESPPASSEGTVTLKEEPGLGLEPNWNVLDEQTVQ